jgi:phosphopantetheine--protein transferase-like protein
MCAICPDPVPPNVRQLLLPAEERFAATLESPDRQREWIAGRVLMAAALSNVSAPRLPILTLHSGAPSIPIGFAGSISHKGPLTIAFADVEVRAVGIDLECVEESDQKLAPRVLTETERSRMPLVDERSKPLYITAHFAVKEAVFKALREEDQSSVDFEHIELSASAAQLAASRVWTQFGVSVMTRDQSHVRVSLFWDQGWIVAAASRE